MAALLTKRQTVMTICAMDDTDQQLISLLRQNARLSIADLAHKMGVSRGTVNNRLRKLEEQQIIVGYTVRLRPDSEPAPGMSRSITN